MLEIGLKIALFLVCLFIAGLLVMCAIGMTINVYSFYVDTFLPFCKDVKNTVQDLKKQSWYDRKATIIYEIRYWWRQNADFILIIAAIGIPTTILGLLLFHFACKFGGL